MIQFNCPHCGKAIRVGEHAQGKKGTCHGCKKTIRVPHYSDIGPADTVEPQPPSIDVARAKQQQQKALANTFVGCIGIGCLLPIMLIFAVAFFSSGDGSGSSDSGAELKARQCVRAHLLSPSSADFGWDAPSISRDGANTVTVTGKVEVKNAFGVMISHTYVCELRDSGNSNWQCESVSLY